MAHSRAKRLDRRRRERETSARLWKEFTSTPPHVTRASRGSYVLRGVMDDQLVIDDPGEDGWYTLPETFTNTTGVITLIFNESVDAGQMITESMIARPYGPLHLDPVSAVQAAIADGVLPYCGVGWFHDTSEYIDILPRKTLEELHDLWFFVERERLRVDEFDHTGNGTKKRLRGIVRALGRWSERIESELRRRSSEPDRLVGGCIGE